MTDERAGLYLHVPFCSRICPYCDFAVRTGDRARRARFVDDLLDEIRLWTGFPEAFDTIYFGGGTPSSLAPDALRRIVDAARATFRFPALPWISLEANPEDVTAEAVAAWRELGVRFLSLGVQSLDARSLEFLGRRHGPADARRAVARALDGGFHTVSIDLIYGLPGQTPAAWGAELDRAIELGAHHLSCYQLTIHDRTRFGLLERRGRLVQLDDETQGALFRMTHRRLADAGYEGYEASNFAGAAAHRSRHNRKYWHHTPYLGLGPSAHSFLDRRRWWNLRRSDAWQESVRRGERPIEGDEALDDRALALEILMLGLRTDDGVDLDRLDAVAGESFLQANRERIEQLEARGFLRLEGRRLRPTLDGLAVADGLAAGLELPGGARRAPARLDRSLP